MHRSPARSSFLSRRLPLQRPASHPQDRVRLGDGPGAAQRPRPPRREGSQGGLRHQGPTAGSGAVQHTGVILTLTRSSSDSTDFLPIAERVRVNQTYEGQRGPAALRPGDQVCSASRQVKSLQMMREVIEAEKISPAAPNLRAWRCVLACPPSIAEQTQPSPCFSLEVNLFGTATAFEMIHQRHCWIVAGSTTDLSA